MIPLCLLLPAALILAATTLHAQDSADTVQTTPGRMYYQYGMGTIGVADPLGYGLQIRLASPIRPLPGLRLLTDISFIRIPDSSTPVGFQAIIALSLSWHLLRFDQRSSGLYIMAGPAFETSLGNTSKENVGTIGLDLGVGVQIKTGLRTNLYIDAQYTAGYVNRAQLTVGFLNGR